MAAGRHYGGGTGVQTSAFLAGGDGTSLVNTTEEFTGETSTETASSIDFD